MLDYDLLFFPPSIVKPIILSSDCFHSAARLYMVTATLGKGNITVYILERVEAIGNAETAISTGTIGPGARIRGFRRFYFRVDLGEVVTGVFHEKPVGTHDRKQYHGNAERC